MNPKSFEPSSPAPAPEVHRRTIVVDGITTTYLEAGAGCGDPLVLLHGGEFGANAEVGWERNIVELATRHHVFAPDQLGYGGTAKVIDFNEGRLMRIRHVARFCDAVGVETADFVGNSMGGLNLLVDASSPRPLLPVRRMVLICGGGAEILRNAHTAAMFEYDATFEGMRAIVQALFHDPAYPADDGYVQRRYESSIAPGAWEAIAAARFHRPGAEGALAPSLADRLHRVAVPTLIVEGGADKVHAAGWAAGVAKKIPGAQSLVVESAGHCPQIEQPAIVNELLLDHLNGSKPLPV